MSSEAPTATRPHGDSDSSVRWGNLLVWGFIAFLATALGMMLIPLTTSGGVRLPLAPIVALVANLALPRVMLRGTDWKWSKYLPAAVWAICALAGASPTSGGDLLIPGNSYSSAVGLAYLGVGALGAIVGIAFAGVRLESFRRRQPVGAGEPRLGADRSGD